MPKAQKNQTLLVVDDDQDNRDFVTRTFRNDFRVLQAEDGQEALDLLSREPVHVIVTDQRMPRMSGTQLLERSLAINPKIVKIILSAYTDTADILSAVNVCRINHYLVKPVNAEKLRAVVMAALKLVPDSVRFD